MRRRYGWILYYSSEEMHPYISPAWTLCVVFLQTGSFMCVSSVYLFRIHFIMYKTPLKSPGVWDMRTKLMVQR